MSRHTGKYDKIPRKKVLRNLYQWRWVYDGLKEATIMNVLKALAVGLVVYVGMVLSVVVLPFLLLLCLWTGLCALAAAFLLFFWFFVTHTPHTLYSSLYMLAYGALPCLGSSLGFYYGKLRNRRSAPLLTLRQDAPFR
jgi:uncharacterized membrane protein YphA (DoxX/SURF4 family)